MCGIVGAVAERNVAPVLLEGLKRLEYRGYDSAGIAIIHPETNQIDRVRTCGKVQVLANLLKDHPLIGSIGIGHTRWATHGHPSEKNAHPHISHPNLAVVHNGIIENHDELRPMLQKAGFEFTSETDTEVIVHLINYELRQEKNLLKAIQKAVKKLHGAYGIGVIDTTQPDAVYAVRNGSPLVIGIGIGENFIASDVLALLPVTHKFIYLEEGDSARVTKDAIEIFDVMGTKVQRVIHETTLSADNTSKGGYRHYMLKEIYEQAQVAIDALDGRFMHQRLVEQAFGVEAPRLFAEVKRIHIVACGTSYHAGLVARYWLEELTHVACQVEIASEYRYRKVVVEPNTLFVALSQSGETADTLSALRKAKQSGYCATLAICNVAASSLVREADLAFMVRAGTEIGVAATKSFTAQLIALLMLTIALLQHQEKNSALVAELIEQLQQLPQYIQAVLSLNTVIEELSQKFIAKNNALFLGRGAQYPIAMEGALKLKEISYMHAEAYAAGELKHGPLALVDSDMPVIVTAPKDDLIAKIQSNVQEVQARGGKLFVFADNAINWQPNEQTIVINMPAVPTIIAPIIYNIPLQLLSYHVAVAKGTDVDQPRNLAKSVTVE